MKSCLRYLNPQLFEYAKILSQNEEPEFLCDYIQTEAMQRIKKVGINCGTQFTNIYNHKLFVNNLEHSICVALIIWNFTKDKKQTLAGLFHDIATPVFKHSIDYMNGDYKNQESTEALTTKILKDSNDIMELLKKDNIKIEKVNDYHIYPIADNDTPKLSADRLEYTFMNGLIFNSKNIFNLEQIKEIYEDIIILENEKGIEELGFKNIEIATKFVLSASKMWMMWYNNENRLTMQFIGDTVKKMIENKELSVSDLYKLSEEEVIYKIENSKDEKVAENFKKFRRATQIYESNKPVKNKYCISVPAKRRYIIPLVKTYGKAKRIIEVSDVAKEKIEEYLAYEPKKYAYLDF